MPIYEYRCPNGHTFEVFQRMTDEPVVSCETCGAAPVEKVLFPVAVHFKGSGFYATDYGKGSRKTAKDGSGESGSTEKKETKTDTSTTSTTSSSSSESKKPSSGD
ncbi:MAG: FmdB family zinc ribbon protein [Gaiella sp.]